MKHLISRYEWAAVKLRLPEGTTPEEAGFLLHYTAEQLDLLMRLRERWNTRG